MLAQESPRSPWFRRCIELVDGRPSNRPPRRRSLAGRVAVVPLLPSRLQRTVIKQLPGAHGRAVMSARASNDERPAPTS